MKHLIVDRFVPQWVLADFEVVFEAVTIVDVDYLVGLVAAQVFEQAAGHVPGFAAAGSVAIGSESESVVPFVEVVVAAAAAAAFGLAASSSR